MSFPLNCTCSTLEAAQALPINLLRLHAHEESLRLEAFQAIASDERLQLHIAAVESAMDLLDLFHKIESADEDFRAIQILAMRMFNAFGASLKLILSGYHQNGALILRDVLETVFLIDYFESNRSEIARWRFADKKLLLSDFGPGAIRRALNIRDGFKEDNRKKLYGLFSDLAAHASMNSVLMMRPERDGLATIGPFIATTLLGAVISEKGKLAIQAGEKINNFFPKRHSESVPSRTNFMEIRSRWASEFYPNLVKKKQ